MSTRFITCYLAFSLTLLASTAALIMILELRDGTGTPMYILAFAICFGLFLIANRLAHQRSWAVAAFTLFCGLGVQNRDLMSCLYLAHAIAGALVILLRGRELKPGL